MFPNGQPKLRDGQTPSKDCTSRTIYADMMQYLLLCVLILGTAAHAEELPPVSTVDLRRITHLMTAILSSFHHRAIHCRLLGDHLAILLPLCIAI